MISWIAPFRSKLDFWSSLPINYSGLLKIFWSLKFLRHLSQMICGHHSNSQSTLAIDSQIVLILYRMKRCTVWYSVWYGPYHLLAFLEIRSFNHRLLFVNLLNTILILFKFIAYANRYIPFHTLSVLIIQVYLQKKSKTIPVTFGLLFNSEFHWIRILLKFDE